MCRDEIDIILDCWKKTAVHKNFRLRMYSDEIDIPVQ